MKDIDDYKEKHYEDYKKTLLPQTSSPFKKFQGNGIKMSLPKLLLQRLPILHAQRHAGSTSENLLNEIRQVIYSLY